MPRAAFAAALLGASCVHGLPRIVEPRDIAEAGGEPDIEAILDLGGRDIPLTGTLDVAGSDGVAAIGETIWIRGDDFGKQPTVLVAGRAAAVLSRTHDGGILTRIPPGVPPGPQAVSVGNERGGGQRLVTIRRIAAVIPPAGGRVAWAEVTADGAVPLGDTEVLDARIVRLSSEGRAAYVAGGKKSVITVLELPSAVRPAPARQIDLGGGPVVALAAAVRAQVLAVVADKRVTMLDISSPLRPSRSAPRPLPAEVASGKVLCADLSPDGRWLAVGVEDGNRVVLLDLSVAGKATLAGEVALAPDVRVGVVVDIAFSPGGDTVWALTGDTASSRPTGPQPTRVHAIRLEPPSDGRSGTPLVLARTVQVAEASDPMRISTGRALPLVSGAAVRLPPEKATVYFTAAAREGKRHVVFRIGAEDAASELAGSFGPLGGADLSPDGRWLLAAALGGDGGLGLLVTRADGHAGSPISLDLLPASRAAPVPGRPAAVPEVRIQP